MNEANKKTVFLRNEANIPCVINMAKEAVAS